MTNYEIGNLDIERAVREPQLSQVSGDLEPHVVILLMLPKGLAESEYKVIGGDKKGR